MFQRLKSIPWLPLILGLTLLRLITAASMDLVPDEAYYWLWSQHPAFGYFDHPPMVAWWITASTTLFGHSPLAVRLPFLLSFAGLLWFSWDTAKSLFHEAVARRVVLWLNACLLLSVGSIIATPDPPSVLMWSAGLWALARLHTSNKPTWWLVFGLFAGLGVEAKYTNLFLGLGVAAWMLLDKPARRWLLTPWPYLGGLTALCAVAPNLLWNAHHDWISVTKQFGRIDRGHFTVKFLIEFLLSQPLLLNPLICVFTILGAKTALRATESPLCLLVALPMPLLAYLLIHVFHDRIQGNWPAPVFPGLVILAAAAAQTVQNPLLTRLRWLAAPFGVGLSALILATMALSTKIPNLGAPWQGWTNLTHNSHKPDWIATTDYDTHGELAYHATGAYPLFAMAERQRYPWQGAPPTGKALIVVAPNHTPDLARCFSDLTEAGTLSRTPKPGKKTTFRLFTGTLKSPDCDLGK